MGSVNVKVKYISALGDAKLGSSPLGDRLDRVWSMECPYAAIIRKENLAFRGVEKPITARGGVTMRFLFHYGDILRKKMNMRD